MVTFFLRMPDTDRARMDRAIAALREEVTDIGITVPPQIYEIPAPAELPGILQTRVELVCTDQQAQNLAGLLDPHIPDRAGYFLRVKDNEGQAIYQKGQD